MRRLCATVLIMEAVVIGLAIPVAITIEHVKHAPAGIAGGVLAALTIRNPAPATCAKTTPQEYSCALEAPPLRTLGATAPAETGK